MSTLAFDLTRLITRETAVRHRFFHALIASRQEQANNRIRGYLARFSDADLVPPGLKSGQNIGSSQNPGRWADIGSRSQSDR